MALFSPVGTGRPGDGLSLLSPSAGFAALSPLALFASPRPALKEGRLSFDVLLAEHDGPPAGSASVLEAMGAPQLKGGCCPPVPACDSQRSLGGGGADRALAGAGRAASTPAGPTRREIA